MDAVGIYLVVGVFLNAVAILLIVFVVKKKKAILSEALTKAENLVEMAELKKKSILIKTKSKAIELINYLKKKEEIFLQKHIRKRYPIRKELKGCKWLIEKSLHDLNNLELSLKK